MIRIPSWHKLSAYAIEQANCVFYRSCVLVLIAIVLGTSLRSAELDLNAPLPVDPNVTIGTLPNKFTYWIRNHKTPPGKITMWLHVGSGSINEEDNQRGLAHYLEHMAFNGSEHFAPGTLVKYFESLGLRFGGDQNAFTSFEQTTYQITLPDTKPETIAKGMQCLSDFGFCLGLPQEKLDTERGVILEEARARKGPQQRIMDKEFPLLAPGSRISERMPIGKEEIIKEADRQRFADYYAKWYRPDNSTLLVVGDADTKVVADLVAKYFDAWKPVEHPAEDADPGIKNYNNVRAGVITDPELSDTDVSAIRIAPIEPQKTIGDFRNRLIEELGSWIVNRRYDELKNTGSAPYQSAEVSISPFVNVCKYSDASASGKPEKWEPMLTTVLLELKRVREYGFLKQELNDAKKAKLASAEFAAQKEGTLDARTFAGNMNNSIAQKIKPISQAQRLELLKQLLPEITRETLLTAFRMNFDPSARLLLVTMPEKKDLPPPTEKEILDVAAKAEAATIEPLAEKERPKSLLETEPILGTVAAQEEDPDLQILSATLSNGVRVHLRSMDFKKNEVFVQISIAGGEIQETAANKGITEAACSMFSQPATTTLASTVIRDMMTGKNVHVEGGATQDLISIAINGGRPSGCSPKDIEEGLREVYAILTHGKIEESAFKDWKDKKIQELERIKTEAHSQTFQEYSNLLSGGDVRIKRITKEQLDKITLPDAQAWLDAIVRSPIEASIVGDIDREQALALAQKYLGSLPKRETPDLLALRKIEQKKGPLVSTVEIPTITPRAEVLTGWRGADWKDVKDRRVLQLAGLILDSRLRVEIREKRSLTYSSALVAQPSRVYEGMGIFSAYFTTDPDKVSEATKLASDTIVNFVADGPFEEEINTVHKQIRNQLDVQMREPIYWINVLSDLDYRGTKLSDVKEVVEKMTSYTRNDLVQVLKRYVTDDRRVEVIAKPVPTGAASENEKK